MPHKQLRGHEPPPKLLRTSLSGKRLRSGFLALTRIHPGQASEASLGDHPNLHNYYTMTHYKQLY